MFQHSCEHGLHCWHLRPPSGFIARHRVVAVASDSGMPWVMWLRVDGLAFLQVDRLRAVPQQLGGRGEHVSGAGRGVGEGTGSRGAAPQRRRAEAAAEAAATAQTTGGQAGTLKSNCCWIAAGNAVSLCMLRRLATQLSSQSTQSEVLQLLLQVTVRATPSAVTSSECTARTHTQTRSLNSLPNSSTLHTAPTSCHRHARRVRSSPQATLPITHSCSKALPEPEGPKLLPASRI